VVGATIEEDHVGYLTPVTTTPPRPNQDDLRRANGDVAERASLQARVLYLKSYLFMRALIGVIGIIMPISLIVFDSLLTKHVSVRGSLSGYYHSGVRDIFVGSLCAVAVFLITYKVFEHNLDNTLSTLAGLGALGVAFFPTGRPEGATFPPTPFQEYAGEVNVKFVHYTSAAIFILSLALISLMFGLREAKRSQQTRAKPARLSPTFWKNFHFGCTVAIFAGVGFIVVTQAVHWFANYSLFVGEVVAVVAFGLSWFAKGLELLDLLGLKGTEPTPDAKEKVEVATEAA
jgi:hypothetical protein